MFSDCVGIPLPPLQSNVGRGGRLGHPWAGWGCVPLCWIEDGHRPSRGVQGTSKLALWCNRPCAVWASPQAGWGCVPRGQLGGARGPSARRAERKKLGFRVQPSPCQAWLALVWRHRVHGGAEPSATRRGPKPCAWGHRAGQCRCKGCMRVHGWGECGSGGGM